MSLNCLILSGLFQPFKVFLQELRKHKLDWDEPLPDNLKTHWNTIATSSQTPPINRPYLGSDADCREFHVFMDASKKGYEAVVYICQDGKSSLIMSKTRVAPLRELTLPKLELMAAVIGSRLLKFILTSLSPIYSGIPVYMWSDSQIVLYWINSSKKLPQFVSRRIAEIQSVPVTSWKY